MFAARHSALLALCIGVAAIFAAALLLRPSPQDTAEKLVPPVARQAVDEGPRIRYPATDYPSLTLPDGSRQTVRSLLNVPSRMEYGDYVWKDDTIPPGPVWVRIDLERQMLSVFRDGHEVGTAVILYGADIKETPGGVFPVLQKVIDYHSRTYDAPMPFMLRLTPDGVAIHGADVREGAATHGCIGVPPAFAQLLYDQVNVGDRVAIFVEKKRRTAA